MATVEYPHISLTPDGVPVITGAGTKVVQIVLDHLAYGSDAEEIHREFPYLSLSAIHCALAYYYDHKEKMDEDIERRKQKVEDIKAKLDAIQGPSPLRERLRAEGRLS